MTTEPISPDLKTILGRLRLSRILDTLSERLVLARQQQMPHQDWLLLILSDDSHPAPQPGDLAPRAEGLLGSHDALGAWDPSAKVTFDRALLNDLTPALSRQPRRCRDLRAGRRRQNVSRPRPRAHRLSPRRPCARYARNRCSRRSSRRASITAPRPSPGRSASTCWSWMISRSMSSTRSRVAISMTSCSSAIVRGVDRRNVEPRPGRMVGHLRGSDRRAECHRPLDQQRLRSDHRRRILPAATQTAPRDRAQ
jgi:hypothetical protein